MEVTKTNGQTLSLIMATVVSCWLVISVKAQNSQINTPCSSSMMTTLTPCLNYITGSNGNGSARTSVSDCCEAFKTAMSTSMDCACLLVTASVPLPLSLSLPRICNSGALQCKASGTPLPAPGPLQFASPPPSQESEAPSPSSESDTPAPSSSSSPQAPEAAASSPADGPEAAKAASSTPTTKPAAARAAAAAEPTAAKAAAAPVKQPSSPRVRPVPTPSSASSSLHLSMASLSTIFLTFMAFLIFY